MIFVVWSFDGRLQIINVAVEILRKKVVLQIKFHLNFYAHDSNEDFQAQNPQKTCRCSENPEEFHMEKENMQTHRTIWKFDFT